MNLYICSTLRHLLFSVLKAINEPDKSSHILLFYDYQKIAPELLDVNSLPPHIRVTLLSRRELTQKMKSSIEGKLYLALALRAIPLPSNIKKNVVQKIKSLIPELNFILSDLNLYVFNERNKMSRLFRLMVPEYDMIEDGVGNYYEVPIKFPKTFIRKLQGMPAKSWVFGESKNCRLIHVIFPEKLPKRVQQKGIEINFLKNLENLEIINNIFKFKAFNIKGSELVIIATQPIPNTRLKNMINDDFLYLINQEIIAYCSKNNIDVLMKVHPRENENEYKNIFPNIQFLPSKAPLELQILNSNKNISIVSINSSAGLGLEKYSTRLTLIADSDLHRFYDIIHEWDKDISQLKKAIKTVFEIQFNDKF